MPVYIDKDPTNYTVDNRYGTTYDDQFKEKRQAADIQTGYLAPQEMSIAPSKYDAGYIYNPTDPYGTLENLRGERQSGFAKIGAGLGKGVVLAGTTAADGIIGTVVGLGNLVSSGEDGEQEFSDFWNNPFSRKMQEINDASEEWMPNYYTTAEKNSSFLGQMGYANFWGDKFAKNLGFAAGAVIDGIITGGVGAEVLGVKALASKVPSAIANAAMKGDKALSAAIALGDALSLSADVIKNAKALSRVNNINQGLSAALSAQGEARFEAISNSKQFFDSNKAVLDTQLEDGSIDSNTYNSKLSELQNATEGMGNADFLANAVILGISNGIQFKNMFTKGFNPTKNIASNIQGSIANGYTIGNNLLGNIAKISKNVLAEGVYEEMGQFAAQKGAEDFYQRKYDGKIKGTIDDAFKSVYTGLAESYGTREGWDQGLIGSLTGALGLPTISRNQKTGKLQPDIAGGIWGDIKEIKEENNYNREALDKLNRSINSAAFKNNYQSLIRNLSLEDAKQKAALNGDKFEVLNKEHDQFVNDALSFIRAGKYDDFVDNLNNIKNSNGDEVRELFKSRGKSIEDQTRMFYGEQPVTTPQQKKYIDTFGSYTSDEIKEKINKNATTMLSDAKKIKDLYTAVSTKYPDISEDTKDKLIYTTAKLDNVNSRINTINNNIVTKIGVDANDVINIVNTKDENGNKIQIADLGDYMNKVTNEAVKNAIQGKITTDESNKIREEVKDIPKLMNARLQLSHDYLKFSNDRSVKKLDESTVKQKDNLDNTNQDLNEEEVEQDVPTTPNIVNNGPNEPTTPTEPLNDTDVPVDEQSLHGGANSRKLKHIYDAITNADKGTGKEVNIRNKEFDEYLSTPDNDMSKDEIELGLDLKEDPARWNKIDPKLKEKLQNNKYLTSDEADVVINNTPTSRDRDFYTSPVDLLPIAVIHSNKETGKRHYNGLYIHDPAYVTSDTLNIPEMELKNLATERNVSYDVVLKEYLDKEKSRVREFKKQIAKQLLQGKKVRIVKVSKTTGFINNTGEYTRIDKALKTSKDSDINANEIVLSIADNSGNLYNGKGINVLTLANPGNVFFTTDKTANKEIIPIKVNLQKISRDHAKILYAAYVLGGDKDATGKIAGVEGLTPNQIKALLVNQEKNPKGKEHLTSKILYKDKAGILHYGTNEINTKSATDEQIEHFVDYITQNKNYVINKDITVGDLTLAINKPLKKKFKLGTLESDGNGTYSGFVIKSGFILTDVSEYKNTGSLTKSPTLIFDHTGSNLVIEDKIIHTVKPNPVVIPTTSTTEVEIKNGHILRGEKTTKKATTAELLSIPTGSSIMSSKEEDDSKEVVGVIIEKNGKKYISQTKIFDPNTEKYHNELPIDDARVVSRINFGKRVTYEVALPVVNVVTTEETVAPITIDLSNLIVVKPLADLGTQPINMTSKPEDIKGYEVWNPIKELGWLEEKLGIIEKTNPDQLYGYIRKEEIISVGLQGKRVFGQLNKEGILLANNAKRGVAYHEGFHYVSNILLDDAEQTLLYQEARKKYNLPTSYTDRDVEEHLADEFTKFVINKEQQKKTGLLGQIRLVFERLYSWLYNLLTGPNKLITRDVNRLFEAINKGKLKNRTASKANIDRLGEAVYNMTYRDIKLNAVDSYKDFRNVIKGLASIAISDVSKQVFVTPKDSQYSVINIQESLDKINVSGLKETIQNKVNEYNVRVKQSQQLLTLMSTNAQQVIDAAGDIYGSKDKLKLRSILEQDVTKYTNLSTLYQEVVDTWEDVYKHKLNDYLGELKIATRDLDSDEKEEVESKDFINDKTDVEYNRKDNVRGMIKFLIGNLHMSPTINPTTDTYDYVEFDEVWNELVNLLWDSDSIEQMISKLDLLAGSKYYYNQLANTLRSGSEVLRTQFETTLRLHKHNMMNTIVYKSLVDGKTVYEFNMINADILNASKGTVKEWSNNFVNNNTANGVISKEFVEYINESYNKFKVNYNDYLKANKNATNLNIDEYKKHLVTYLSKIGVNIDLDTVNQLILTELVKTPNTVTESIALRDIILNVNKVFSDTSILYKYANDKDKVLKNSKFKFENILDDESVIKNIAEAYNTANPTTTSTNVPGPGGNERYKIGANTYVTDSLKNLHNGGLEYINDQLQDVFNQGSYIYEKLKESPEKIQNISLGTYNAFLVDNTGDEGRDYLDISPIEDLISKMQIIQSGYMPFPTMADRKTYYVLTGVPTLDIRMELTKKEDGSYSANIPDYVVDVFYKYALAERNRIAVAEKTLLEACGGSFKDIDGNVVSKNDNSKVIHNKSLLIENYHYRKDGETYLTSVGNAYKYQLFSEFNREDFDFDSQARDEIKKVLNARIKETNKYLTNELGIIENGEFNVINESVLKEAAEQYRDQMSSEDFNVQYKRIGTSKLLSDYTIKTMMASIESMVMFTGDIAFFKADGNSDPSDDYVKRLSVLTSSGEKMREIIPNEFDHSGYNSTIVATQNVSSLMYNQLGKVQTELIRRKYPEYTDEQIAKIVKRNLVGYKKINASDGAVLISAEFSREIEVRRGNWSPEMEEAYNLLESDKELSDEEEQKLLNVVLQSKKYVSYDRLKKSTNSATTFIPTYDKMSLATMFRRYSKGTYMEGILDRMELKGDYAPNGKYNPTSKANPNGLLEKIHELKFDSAVKVGVTQKGNLLDIDDKTNEVTGVSDLSKLLVVNQNIATLRHQVYTDPHHVEDTLFGSQVKKVVMSDIIDDAEYTLPDGSKATGEKVKNVINKCLGELSNRGAVRLKEEFGIDAAGNLDKAKTYNDLYKEAKQGDMPENVQDMLRNEISLDALPDRSWIFSRMIAKVNKRVIDTKLPGNQLIQVTGFASGSDGKVNNLKFMFDDEGNIKGVEAKLSVSVYNNIIPKDIIKFEDKRKWLLANKDKLEGLGYRIPTQGQNSTVAITVVDFLPESVGDAIILPDEFVALTGSDFDIDKLFFITYNYKTDDKGNVSKVEYKGSIDDIASNSTKAIQNYMLDYYRSILLSPPNFIAATTPLGAVTDELKNLADEVSMYEWASANNIADDIVSDKKLLKDTYKKYRKDRKSLSFTTPEFQAKVKYKYSGGKSGVGPSALNNVHHILGQIAKLRFSIPINKLNLIDLNKIEGEDGIAISSWLSAMIDSHVDIAKDPYIMTLNVNEHTYNATFLLLRLGLGAKTFNFLAQPILKDFVRAKNIENGTIKPTFKDKAYNRVYEEYFTKLNKLAKKDNLDAEGLVKKAYEELDIINDNTLLNNLKTKESNKDIKWIAKQLAILQYFRSLNGTHSPGAKLNELVMASRVDTKKYGKTITEIRNYLKSIENVLNTSPIINSDKLVNFSGKVNDGDTFLPAYIKNGPMFIKDTFSQMSITGTEKFNELVDAITANTKALTKGESADSRSVMVANQIMSTIHGKFFTEQMQLSNEDIKTLMNNTVSKLQSIASSDTYSDLKNNKLITLLSQGIHTEEGLEELNTFIGLSSSGNADKYTKEQLTYSWIDLLDDKREDVARFANDLFIYSYMMSGFKRSSHSFNQYAPSRLYNELVYKDNVYDFDAYIKQVHSTFSNNGVAADSLKEQLFKDVFINNWTNDKFVTTPSVKSEVTTLYSNANKIPILVAITKENKPYVLHDGILLERIGTIKDGTNVYRTINKKGYSSTYNKSIFKGWNIVESGNNSTQSIVKSNNILSDKELNRDYQAIAKQDNVKGYTVSTFIQEESPMDRYLKLKPTMDDIAQDDIDVSKEDRSLRSEDKSDQESSPSDIYNQLGNKTQSDNVLIKPWGELKENKVAILPQGIVATRIPNTNEHFGNPFSHDPAGKTQGLIKTETIREAVEKYINWVINSQEARAEWIREQLKSGELKNKPVFYYKELGEPSHATALDYLINNYKFNGEANLGLKSNVDVITNWLDTENPFKTEFTPEELSDKYEKEKLSNETVEEFLHRLSCLGNL